MIQRSKTVLDEAARERKLAYMRKYNALIAEDKKIYNKRWYQEHKEHCKAAAREYRVSNPEKAKESQALYRSLNKERLAEYSKNYQEKNQKIVAQRAREKRLEFFARAPKEAWIHYTFRAAQGRARRRGLSYDTDYSALLLPDACPVLELTLRYGERRKYPAPDSPSLDRIIPELGYVISNLRVISWRANVLKRDASVDEIRRVLAYVEGCLSMEKS